MGNSREATDNGIQQVPVPGVSPLSLRFPGLRFPDHARKTGKKDSLEMIAGRTRLIH